MLVLILDGAVPSYESCHRVSYISGQNVMLPDGQRRAVAIRNRIAALVVCS